MMPAMESLIKLFNIWEIQLLVLLSFALQIFLFFTGILRQHGTSSFLKYSMWAAYLGADFVAVYTLGILSRQDLAVERHAPRKTQPLAFFWGPFLLIHLGGQDTITAFAMQDNDLWLRNSLNLVVRVILAIYVFWKSIGRHSLELLVSGIFVFVVGMIKYGERIWYLKCGSFKSLESSTGHRYKKQLPGRDIEEIMDEDFDIQENISDGYDSMVCIALRLMPTVHDIFSGRNMFSEGTSPLDWTDKTRESKKIIKIVSINLSLMYADLYTKALGFRTRSVIILRCIAQMSAVVAFALFHANDKQMYNKIDIAITYSLFVGGFFLELCAMFISLMSPWTWAWLKVRECDMLARLSWFIFSSNIGWPEEKQWWPKSMGQYMLLSWVSGSGQARTFNQRVMTMVKRFADLVCVERKKIFWMSKLLDTEDVYVDKMTVECVAEEIIQLSRENARVHREWPNVLEKIQIALQHGDFGATIVMLHVLTEKHLSKYTPSAPGDMEANAGVPLGLIEVCRKLSNYMMYLLVTNPSMLPLAGSAVALLERVQDPEVLENLIEDGLQLTNEVVQELVYMWARILIYAAGKSRAETHAAQLSGGGELITFVWLLMAIYNVGDSQRMKIRITDSDIRGFFVEEIYAFRAPAAGPSKLEASGSQQVTED